jgi:hypothetical protein
LGEVFLDKVNRRNQGIAGRANPKKNTDGGGQHRGVKDRRSNLVDHSAPPFSHQSILSGISIFDTWAEVVDPPSLFTARVSGVVSASFAGGSEQDYDRRCGQLRRLKCTGWNFHFCAPRLLAEFCRWVCCGVG